MNKLCALFIVLFFSSCSHFNKELDTEATKEALAAESFDGESLYIVAFNQGKMLQTNGQWSIYENSEQLQYQVNGECIFNQRATPCMWHGYIIEYFAGGEDVILDCSLTQNIGTNIGTPSRILKANSKTFDYQIVLRGNEHIYVNPQYVTRGTGIGVVESLTTCKHREELVLEFTHTLVFEDRS